MWNGYTHTTVKRDELYEQVWSESMKVVAKRYAISENALKKICAELSVPFPNPIYWMKLENGEKPAREPLPPLKIGQPAEHVISKQNPPIQMKEDSEFFRPRRVL